MDNAIWSVISTAHHSYQYLSLRQFAELNDLIPKLPYALITLLENTLRNNLASPQSISQNIASLGDWLRNPGAIKRVMLKPSMISMQELSGISAALDLALISSAAEKLNKNLQSIKLNISVDIVVDQQAAIDSEVVENKEYRQLLTWVCSSFDNLRIVSSQDSLIRLASIIHQEFHHSKTIIYPNLIIGTNPHLAKFNGLAIPSIKVSSLEEKAAMLGQRVSIDIPEIVGVRLPSFLASQATTDIVSLVIGTLKTQAIHGKLVEFFGYGLSSLNVDIRALIAQKVVEFGAICGFFPIDTKTTRYLQAIGKSNINLIERYAKVQGLWHEPELEKKYSTIINLDLAQQLTVPDNSDYYLDLPTKAPEQTMQVSAAKALLNLPIAKENILKAAIYNWEPNSSYITIPFHLSSQILPKLQDITKAKILAMFGDGVSTDQIIPTGTIKTNSVAGQYLSARGIKAKEFNTYEARLGNSELMLCAAFTGENLKNELSNKVKISKEDFKYSLEESSIHNISTKCQASSIPLVIIAGKDYGIGKSKEWAAKAPALLGVRAIIAESFDPIHRSNLISLGVIPLTFMTGLTRYDLNFSGDEAIDIWGLEYKLTPKQKVVCSIAYKHGLIQQIDLILEADSEDEVLYLKALGVIPHILDQLDS